MFGFKLKNCRNLVLRLKFVNNLAVKVNILVFNVKIWFSNVKCLVLSSKMVEIWF